MVQGRENRKSPGCKKTAMAKYTLIKEERMPDGKIKRILRDRKTGDIIQRTGNA